MQKKEERNPKRLHVDFLDTDEAKELNIATDGSRTVETGETHPISMTFARGTTLQVSGLKIPIEQLAVMPLKFRRRTPDRGNNWFRPVQAIRSQD